MKDRTAGPTEIHVVDNGRFPQVELKGRSNDVLIAWGWLTLAICERFGMSVTGLVNQMPLLVYGLRGALRGKQTIDLAAMEKLKREKENGHDNDS